MNKLIYKRSLKTNELNKLNKNELRTLYNILKDNTYNNTHRYNNLTKLLNYIYENNIDIYED